MSEPTYDHHTLPPISDIYQMLSIQIGSLIMTAEPVWGDDYLIDELRFGGNPTVADIPAAPIQVPVDQRSLCRRRMSGVRPT
ncbi:hypothetical protein [Gordonia sp. (in: high G+C Gram-positive bacteria)]|nr:hypothetical protein [Gordonia sp. (in: high G+C Gram-positive bacteria)]HMS74815.1 hypothetical protein [Gordonia sp. (in: high G+C Gram-positive bacteria)]